jgi:Uma2 family endonuclease
MATAPRITRPVWDNGYPTTDRKPMAETDTHRKLMTALIETLDDYFADQPRVYVSGNLLLFYEKGDKRKHVSPDVFVVRGVPKRVRPNYLVWQEGKAPQVVIELTSKTTRDEDLDTKFGLYRDTLRVREYFLFDPLGDYLELRLQGHRLRGGEYRPVRTVAGRLPSQVLGLHLEPHGWELRLFDPSTGRWLTTPAEWLAERDAARRQAEQAEARATQAEQRAAQAEAENERLRRELGRLRRRRGGA